MPYMKKVNGVSVRDYERENRLYNSKPEQVKNRTIRITTRRQSNASGLTHLHDGMDIDHIKPLSKGGSSGKSNLRVVPASTNRSFSRNANSSVKSQTSKRETKKK